LLLSDRNFNLTVDIVIYANSNLFIFRNAFLRQTSV